MQTTNDDTKQKHGLGRGLDSLIPIDIDNNGDAVKPTGMVDVNLIIPNPHQPRRKFEEEALAELAASIREHGVLQPLLVTKIADNQYELIAGERRLRASKIAGIKEVPVIERSFDEQEKLEIAIIENVQRENLNPMEIALSYRKLMDEFNLSQDDVASKVNRARSTVANTLRLLNLPFEIKEAIAEGKISEGHARALLNLPPDKQMELFHKILDEGLNVREVEHKRSVRTYVPIEKDPNYVVAEKRMSEVLGTKVEIQKKQKGGKVVIDYYSFEELEKIYKKIVG